MGKTVSGFPQEVRRAFSFLNDSYGFRVVDVRPSSVRLESSVTYVTIFRDPLSGEVGVLIGLLRTTPTVAPGFRSRR